MSARRPSLRSVRAAPDTRPRRGTAEETRRRLVAAAAVVFGRDGYAGTDSNRIAREAGYSPGTFYKHFADKKEVFVAAYEAWVAAEWSEVEAIVLDAGSRRAAAARLVARVLELHRRWRVLRRSLRALVAEDADVRRAHVAARSRQLDTLARLRGGRADREADALLLYTLERAADAFADDELDQLGLDAAALERHLVALLVQGQDRSPDGEASSPGEPTFACGSLRGP
jgi:AcrR family transcriptional regulator